MDRRRVPPLRLRYDRGAGGQRQGVGDPPRRCEARGDVQRPVHGVRALLGGSGPAPVWADLLCGESRRTKAKIYSLASSKLSATARHFRRRLRRNALRRDPARTARASPAAHWSRRDRPPRSVSCQRPPRHVRPRWPHRRSGRWRGYPRTAPRSPSHAAICCASSKSNWRWPRRLRWRALLLHYWGDRVNPLSRCSTPSLSVQYLSGIENPPNRSWTRVTP